MRKTEHRSHGLGTSGGVVEDHVREAVQCNVRLERREVRWEGFEGIHLAGRPHGGGAAQREQPHVRSDVEHDIAGSEETPNERRFVPLVGCVKHAPLRVVPQVESHAQSIRLDLGRPVYANQVGMSPLDDEREPAREMDRTAGEAKEAERCARR